MTQIILHTFYESEPEVEVVGDRIETIELDWSIFHGENDFYEAIDYLSLRDNILLVTDETVRRRLLNQWDSDVEDMAEYNPDIVDDIRQTAQPEPPPPPPRPQPRTLHDLTKEPA